MFSYLPPQKRQKFIALFKIYFLLSGKFGLYQEIPTSQKDLKGVSIIVTFEAGDSEQKKTTSHVSLTYSALG